MIRIQHVCSLISSSVTSKCIIANHKNFSLLPFSGSMQRVYFLFIFSGMAEPTALPILRSPNTRIPYKYLHQSSIFPICMHLSRAHECVPRTDKTQATCKLNKIEYTHEYVYTYIYNKGTKQKCRQAKKKWREKNVEKIQCGLVFI